MPEAKSRERASEGARGRDPRSAVMLEGEGLTKRYGGVVALDEVSLQVRAGEILGLVGPNGAGKTTLVDVITGAQAANAGTLTLQGAPIRGSASRRARLGLARTFQHPLLASELSVVENIVTGVSARRMSRLHHQILAMMIGAISGPGTDYATAARLAADVGIDNIERLCADLTLGEQRLVEVARALAQDPLVMLLDEPFAGADSAGIHGTTEAIRAVQARGHAVILVDHNVDLIARLANRVMLLDRGRVVFTGTPAQCLASREMQSVYFGGPEDG